MVKLPEYHVLNYFYDNDNGCALTAFVNGSKYHVIANPSNIQDRSKKGKKVWRDYARLLDQVKAADQGEQEGGNTTAPLFVQPDEKTVQEDGDDGESEGTPDSGVDVRESEDASDEHDCEPTEALQRWILKPLASVFPSQPPKEQSVEDWYHSKTQYYNLVVRDGKLQAEEDTSPSEEVQKRVEVLTPTMNMPKYIMEKNIPLFNAKDLVVLKESDDPGPLHPSVVRVDGKELFIKNVGNSSVQPMVKRELQVMLRIESEGLHESMRVPLLRGLVHFSDSKDNNGKREIMGFLIDAIDSPTPLTHMLDKEVPEDKRTKWATESARMVDLLHQHQIIWGDAKGDNFMVDANDDLWIIDFGGSYTEGWVDPELKETEEGDKQGVQKLRNGLHDPEKYTISQEEAQEMERQDEEAETEQETDEEDEQGDGTPEQSTGRKRKAEDTSDAQALPPSKQRRKSSGTAEDGENPEPLYCYCNKPESGRMLACDGEDCERGWFHFDCVGIKEAPSTKKWFCNDCRSD